ncbi:HAMP domain-containing histidine kinase [bacterium]|nr:HAMP domain-containing histidine kinase [bacterium]
MLIVPRASVRVNLTIAILLTVVFSWVISSGVANYFNYLSFRSFRQEMLKHPDVYPKPIQEPKFGVVEFFTGRPPIPKHSKRSASDTQLERAPENEPKDHPMGPSPMWFELRGLILRLVVALGLAALAGAWMGRKFTKPLTHLARGADAFQSGNFAYRIPARGKNEFAAVAEAMNEMAQQVSDQISHLEEDAERRRQFLADIAHELRSPVTTMGTMAEALKDGLAEEPSRRDFAISALVSTSQRLRRLVQDLMDLAKLDLTELPLNMMEVDMRELVCSVIQSHDAAAAAAGITIHPLESTQPIKVKIDPDRIIQVLDNVIGNAISYAGQGSEVKVTLENGADVRITISDTGKGISAADMPYVLDPFYRADAARTPNDSHSGLGLSIACKLIEAHKGTMTVSSEEGKGTTVTVVIPKAGDGG